MTCTRPNCALCADIARDECPGDGSHYFNKGERRCQWCNRDLTDHKLPTKQNNETKDRT